jgi:uncharacterized protein YbjT (DUF2867 family)
MKLVVFGASGTIGSALTNLVLERHIEVLSLSRTIAKSGCEELKNSRVRERMLHSFSARA